MPDQQEEFRLDNVVAAVEADSFAQFQLWQEWSDSVPETFRQKGDQKDRVDWVEQNIGTLETVGHIDVGLELGGRLPICITMSWATIQGRRVLFYDPCSRLVHHGMVRDWLNKSLPDGYQHSDAMNFANIVHHINRLNLEESE